MKLRGSYDYRFTLLAALLFASACDDRDPYDAQYEIAAAAEERRIEFPGRVVYEDGTPASGVVVVLRIWYRDTSMQGIDQFASRDVRIRTDTNGRFEFTGSGSSLRIMEVSGDGKLLHEQDGFQLAGETKVPGNLGYHYNQKTGGWYVPSEESPAVFVLVRNGHHGVTAWPSRGGKDCFNNGTCVTNKPEVPKEPSVDYEALAAERGGRRR